MVSDVCTHGIFIPEFSIIAVFLLEDILWYLKYILEELLCVISGQLVEVGRWLNSTIHMTAPQSIEKGPTYKHVLPDSNKPGIREEW
jgi:hypothetical protein